MRPTPPLLALALAALFGASAMAMQAGRHRSRIVEAPLHRAIGKGDLEGVRRFLDAGASPDLRTYGGATALGLAVSQDRWPIAELLLARGGDLEAVTYGMPLVRVNTLSDNWSGYDWLMAHGAKHDTEADALARERPPRDSRYVPFPPVVPRRQRP